MAQTKPTLIEASKPFELAWGLIQGIKPKKATERRSGSVFAL